ncbi:replication initiation protein RepM [Rhizobium hidalgonense]|uniref:Replication initiation protein RepM n=1 Tax=Rhizobium hidalgonense TaxID=1538159 RepID=A0AAJ2GXC0_9HYPH|nr:replication initiation protein RepM [Rhizobium hidalgonense]MDR9777605.1 replication initiation protein RepM [Rhizobium hidalgonense]
MSNLVVKDNRLIEASYSLGLVEQRLVLLAIIGARETGEGVTPETLLTVRAEDYAKHFGVERQTAYQALQEAVETLFNRRATVDVYDTRRGKMRPMVVRWVTAMQYEEQQACVTLRFGIEVVPLITRLEQNFTSYELQQIAGLKSAYAIRLYELLMQWKAAAKTPVFELQQFRNQLGVGLEYSRIEAFKRRVLDVAVDQINAHTDITASYEQHKAGRTITGFSFKFKQKKTDAVAPFAKKPKQPKKPTLAWGTSENHLLKELQKKCAGLTKEYVEQLAHKHTKDLSFILNDMFMKHSKTDSFTLELSD